MKNVMPAFEFMEDGKTPDFHKFIECHMVFDVKIGDLTHKVRFMASGHKTDPLKDSSYLFECRIEGQHQDCIPGRGLE